jgi:hypothetical protein
MSIVVVALLIVVVLLLCEPQANRPHALGTIIVLGGIGLAVYYIGPIILGVLGLLFAATNPILEHFGWAYTAYTLGMAIFLVTGAVLGRLRWLDARDNRSIRAGSIEAFDKRVEDYMRIFGYSHEKAIEATMRIRDGKKK